MNEYPSLNDPLHPLRRKKVKKPNPETWGDRINHELLEWDKLKINLDELPGQEDSQIERLINARWQVLRQLNAIFRHYEERLRLKEEPFISPQRLWNITFGGTKFYKRLDYEIESLRMLNKALDGLSTSVAGQNDLSPPGELQSRTGRAPLGTAASQHETYSRPEHDSLTLSRPSVSKEDPALGLISSIKLMYEELSPDIALPGGVEPYFFSRKIELFERWDRSRKGRMGNDTVLALANIAWCLSSHFISLSYRKLRQKELNIAFLEMGFPERGYAWEQTSPAEFLREFGQTIDALDMETEVQQGLASRVSRTATIEQVGSSISSRNKSVGAAKSKIKSPQILPVLDLPDAQNGDQQLEMTYSARIEGLADGYNTYSWNGNDRNGYILEGSQPSVLGNTQRFLGSALTQIAQAPSTAASSSGFTPTIQAALGVGIPTVVAGLATAGSAVSNAVANRETTNIAKSQFVLAERTLSETEAKNIADQDLAKRKLAMEEEKHQFEMDKLKAEHAEREETTRLEKAAKKAAAQTQAQKARDEQAQILRGLTVPRHDFRGDDNWPDDFPATPSDTLTVGESRLDGALQGVKWHGLSTPGHRAPVTKIPTPTVHIPEHIPEPVQDPPDRIAAVNKNGVGVVGADDDDLYSDDSRDAPTSTRQPNRVQGTAARGAAVNNMGAAPLRDPNEGREYEMNEMQSGARNTALTTALGPSSIISETENVDMEEANKLQLPGDNMENQNDTPLKDIPATDYSHPPILRAVDGEGMAEGSNEEFNEPASETVHTIANGEEPYEIQTLESQTEENLTRAKLRSQAQESQAQDFTEGQQDESPTARIDNDVEEDN